MLLVCSRHNDSAHSVPESTQWGRAAGSLDSSRRTRDRRRHTSSGDCRSQTSWSGHTSPYMRTETDMIRYCWKAHRDTADRAIQGLSKILHLKTLSVRCIELIWSCKNSSTYISSGSPDAEQNPSSVGRVDFEGNIRGSFAKIWRLRKPETMALILLYHFIP